MCSISKLLVIFMESYCYVGRARSTHASKDFEGYNAIIAGARRCIVDARLDVVDAWRTSVRLSFAC
jgi:hypothetical protein